MNAHWLALSGSSCNRDTKNQRADTLALTQNVGRKCGERERGNGITCAGVEQQECSSKFSVSYLASGEKAN